MSAASILYGAIIVRTSSGATGGYPRLEGDVVNVVPVRCVGAGPRVQRAEEGHVETVGVGHCLENKSERSCELCISVFYYYYVNWSVTNHRPVFSVVSGNQSQVTNHM